jgi:hypothetical protein
MTYLLSSGTAPCFDGTDYATWKWMMEMYLSAMHPTIWRIVQRGYTVKDTDSPATIQQNEHKNALAVNAILSGLSPNERNKVYGLKTAKEIWDGLQLAHQGTPCHREFKIELLTEELGRLAMEEGETPNEMYDRLICIVNEIKGLGSKEMTDSFVVKKMVRAIAPRNPTLATIIHKQEDFAKLTPHCLLGRVHDLIDHDQRSSSRKKYLAPKERKEAKESSSEEESEDQKRLHKIVKRLGKSKERQSRRPCYECGETGHSMANCPNKKNKGNDEKRKENHNKKNNSKNLKKSQKGQSVIGAEWDSNDSSTDSDDENDSSTDSDSDDENVHMCVSGFPSWSKVSSTSKSRNTGEFAKSDSYSNDDLLDDANEITFPMFDLLNTIKRKEESFKKKTYSSLERRETLNL